MINIDLPFKDLLELSKKRPKTFIILVILYILSFFYNGGAQIQFQEQVQGQAQEQAQSQKVDSSSQAINSVNFGSNVQGDISINHDVQPIQYFDPANWEIDKNRWLQEIGTQKTPTGFYCARESSLFESAGLWYAEALSVGTGIEIRYRLKTINNTEVNPYLIFIYGEDGLFKVFFPDTDSRFIGFEDNSKERTANRFPKNRLIRPVVRDKEAKLIIKTETVLPNRAVISYAFTYIGEPVDEDDHQKQTTEEDSFDSVFPGPDPEKTKHKIGFGTPNGVCVKILSYQIVPPYAE